MRQPGVATCTASFSRRPSSSMTRLPVNCGLLVPAAVNFSSAAAISACISSCLNTAWPIAVAWVFHGSKNASWSDCAIVGATAVSLL